MVSGLVGLKATVAEMRWIVESSSHEYEFDCCSGHHVTSETLRIGTDCSIMLSSMNVSLHLTSKG